MATAHVDKPPEALRYRIQEIKLQPTLSKYDMSLKILADGVEKHLSPKIASGSVLHWSTPIHIDIHIASQIEIRAYEHHLLGRKSRIWSVMYHVTELDASLVINRDCGQPGASIMIIHPVPESNEDIAARVLSNAAAIDRQKRLLEKLGPARNVIKAVLEFGGAVAELDPRAKAIFAAFNMAWGKLEEQEKCDESVATLVNALAGILPSANAVKEAARLPQLRQTIEDLWKIIEDASEFVIEYKSTGEPISTLRTFTGFTAQDTVDQMLNRLRDLKEKFDRGVNVQALLILDEGVRSVLLEKLKPIGKARYDSKRACLSGTRTGIIQEIISWAGRPTGSNNVGESRLMWVRGQAGLGKSAIATSVCQSLDNSGSLAASFFCKRDDPKRRNPERILATIIYSLAIIHPTYGVALQKALEADLILSDSPMQMQFEKLVQGVIESQELVYTGPQKVIVVDAFDEAESTDERRQLLEYLEVLSGMLSWLKIIVTSRPDSDIKGFFESGHGKSFTICNVFEHNASDDIRVYVKHELDQKPSRSKLLPIDAAQSIVAKSSGLFIWARTACELVLYDDDPPKALDDVLNSTMTGQSSQALDDLYTMAIKASRDRRQRADKATEAVRKCLGAIIVCSTRTPLSIKALSKLYGDQMSENVLQSVVDRLGSVLYVDHGLGDAIRVYHASFADYMLDPARSGEYAVDQSEQNSHFAARGLSIMMNELKFNICGLETSYKRNDEVEDLKQRIDENIQPHLRYSCTYWTDHLASCVEDQNRRLREGIKRFFSGVTVLYWIEVLSLLMRLNVVSPSIQALQSYLTEADTEIYKLLKDVERFVRAFSIPIRESTPHLYTSALAFLPSDSLLGVVKEKQFSNTIRVIRGMSQRWAPWSQLIPHENSVWCVAYSPDGRHIVSGSLDNTVRVWDAHTGAAVGQPLAGHSFSVLSVAYSPDGRHIVSGSDDKTVRVWDAHTGAAVGQPLAGHSSSVWSVAYSPDGRHIVSGSRDNTVRVWDAHTGAAVGQPLAGHSSSVLSVAYSPDGRHIVSGSSDKTVRVWDAHTGAAVGQPLAGHSSSVLSVAYSPDGRHIVSGSSDNTVRVWDAHTGAAVGQPLAGHSSSVWSVAYSPDGRHIVSGSLDNTVRVWDAHTGAAVGQPLAGHSDSVLSVAYSPDGRHIVSGSDDKTVRVWDAHTGAAVGQPLAGHSSSVWSVAYSPDGRHIVSGSRDNTVRVWDAHTGAAVGQPLAGHSQSVNSVAYSPDGRHIVSGSSDKTVRVWDAHTGAAVGQPLAGHSSSVLSVAYSPDGRHIVSGSSDNTVRVWDAHTGAAVGQPLAGHSSSVWSVAYSPDGRHIVSGSLDNTVRVWDAHTGAAVGQPLAGHSDSVLSVAYSPDGRHIVSGSDDKTVRVWDAHTGAAVGQPLAGHSSSVWSVAYSPDGRHIVSGSDDKTVRVWDAHTGAAVGQPLAGHSSSVLSVAYSPDGRHIVSGSDDKTVRVWDAHTGAAVGQPLAGHSDSVNSVAYSPDGRHIVSGSSDKTVRVWDVHTGAAVGQPLAGHSDWVNSVAHSPDGRHIVPGSDDNTIRVQDNSLLHGSPTRQQIYHSPPTDAVSPGHNITQGISAPLTTIYQNTLSIIPLHQNVSHLSQLFQSDGWVSLSPGKLLFWLPPEYQRPRHDDSALVISSNAADHPVWLEMSYFKHGIGWGNVYVTTEGISAQ